ncbi:hypothetical protein [Bacillus licheniformis]|uniref:hypothetical protein n=1 Tax=Bacillus licheniformis TaxID=1402 RepID=UPI0005CF90CF|nr:hypothetical protein [Bacillus licheniformis]TWM12114.1 hypothetical protein CHCC15087_0403 [Bacillus licheniformis]
MIYLLIYGIIGLIIAGIMFFNLCAETMDKYSNENEQFIGILAVFVISLFCSVVWPMIVTLIIIKHVRKAKRRKEENKDAV